VLVPFETDGAEAAVPYCWSRQLAETAEGRNVRSWVDFIIGLIVGVVAVIVVVVCYFRLGFAPVAVSAAPMPFEKDLAQAALHRKTEGAAGVQSPIEASESNLLAGARAYRASCAICHSLPGVGETELHQGMYPKPPALLTGKGVTDDPVGETHWVVQHGIRMTGMPSFAGVFSDTQLWQVSLLLARAHDLPPSVQDLLKQPDMVPVQSAGGEKKQSSGAGQ
jgi:thiosulfate dehydrogenase